MTPRTNFTLRLSSDGKAAIERLAEEEQRTLSDMARILLGEAVTARAKQDEGGPALKWARQKAAKPYQGQR